MEKKKNLIILGVVLGIVLLIGATYAFFTYYRESDKVNELIAGEVYMKFVDGENTIGLINTFPETVEEARAREDNVITFTIDGKNTTTNKDVYYEIKLLYADDIQGKTRFLDEHLKFDLVETTNGVSEMVLNAVSYNEINNKRIWVNTINKNTTTPIERTYQLRMWLSSDILISDTEDYADYTTDEFKNSYANVKVAVYGDFVYKEVAQDASCFAYNNVYNSISYNNLYYDINTTEDAVNTCVNYYTSLWGAEEEGNTVDIGETYESFCNGSGTIIGATFKEVVGFGGFNEEDMTYFIDNNVLIQNDNPTITGIEITDYDVNTCGTDVVIPTYIEGYPVTRIADYSSSSFANYSISNYSLNLNGNMLNSRYNYKPEMLAVAKGVFSEKDITSVRLPETLEHIGEYSFRGNNLTKIIIPSSVRSIRSQAFGDNPLNHVIIKGNPALSSRSFSATTDEFDIFEYGGTCAELYDYVHTVGIFDDGYSPKLYITSDSDSCDVSREV